jgi:integrase
VFATIKYAALQECCRDLHNSTIALFGAMPLRVSAHVIAQRSSIRAERAHERRQRIAGCEGPRAPAGRVRYLQPGELRAVLGASPEWLRPLVALAACTAMRRSELLGLRWLDVGIENGRVMLAQTKNVEGRIVYLNETAKAAITSLSLRSDVCSADLLFQGLTGEQVSMAFARVCKRRGISDFRFHDLRNTAVSWLRMQGADIHTVDATARTQGSADGSKVPTSFPGFPG